MRQLQVRGEVMKLPRKSSAPERADRYRVRFTRVTPIQSCPWMLRFSLESDSGQVAVLGGGQREVQDADPR